MALQLICVVIAEYKYSMHISGNNTIGGYGWSDKWLLNQFHEH